MYSIRHTTLEFYSGMEEIMGTLFDANRILRGADVPTFYSHGTRHVEFLDGDLVRVWLCEDQPTVVSGLAPMSRPVAVVLLPVACYVWSILAHAEDSFDRGILRV